MASGGSSASKPKAELLLKRSTMVLVDWWFADQPAASRRGVPACLACLEDWRKRLPDFRYEVVGLMATGPCVGNGNHR